jgi:ribosome-interacting GTPase 1
MPANLPPEYFEAEKRFRQANTLAEKIATLEDLISTVPKHKGTDKLRGDLRRKLSQLRKEAQIKKKGGKGSIYSVDREGAAQVAIVGFPNSGKSSILASLTNAMPVIADYPISTVTPLPGMMPFEDIQIQLIDLPPIGNEATDGWVSSILRTSDSLLIVVDLNDDPEIQAELIIEQLNKWNIFVINFLKQNDEEKRFKILKRAIIVGNKIDIDNASEAFQRLKERYGNYLPCISISALKKENLEELKKEIFKVTGIIRVYSKPPGKEPDLTRPFTIPKGSTVLDLAGIIHKDFIFNLKFARIWGSAKFEGQRVEKTYILQDKDIVELHI